jgi:ribonuclease R
MLGGMAQGPYARSDRDLAARIARSAGGKAGYKQLVRELGLAGGRERRLMVEQLTRMVARGDLVQMSEGLWAVPKPKGDAPARGSSPSRQAAGFQGRWTGFEQEVRGGRDRLISGKLDLHRDGFGFVRVDAPPAGAASVPMADIFIPPNALNGAMGGDQVLVDEDPPARDGRRSGRIARVLTRRNPTVVGIFHYARTTRRSPGYEESGLATNYVTPLDERVGGVISIPDGEEVVATGAAAPHRTLGEEAQKKRRGWDAATAGEPGETQEATPRSHKGRERIESPDAALEGMAVDVEITRFPQPGRPALGRVIEVLGDPDDFGVDVEIMIRKHRIPHVFPPAVLLDADERARETVASLPPDELALREDFRGLPIVTIDGETARDFDDAVLVRPAANGNTELQVHIADVSWYVRPGSALDTEARVRGTSVYFPDRAVPMLPHALSSGMCSLLPNEDRPVLSCVMEIDPEGEIVGYRVAEGLIRSVRRCTYTTVQRCLNAAAHETSTTALKVTPEPAAEDHAELERVGLEQPELPAAFDRMLELALRLNRKRVRRGSIDFDLPEPIVEFDPDGNMKAIVRSERGWAHRLIEEFMLSANECVATWLQNQGIASIYRVHELPDPKRILEFEEAAATFGQSLGLQNLPVKKFAVKGDRREAQRRSERGGKAPARPSGGVEVPESIPVTPQMYQKLIRRISGHPEERILSYMMLRSLKQARYAEKNDGHFALASPNYTHFTSPIRRYPDLIVHRLLRAMLRDGADPNGGAIHSTDWQPWGEKNAKRETTSGHADGPMAAAELNDIAVESSQSERRAADAERELIEWKKMKFMADKVGDEFKAMVLSVTKYGFFVELNEMFIEGMVPIASLPGDHWTFRDTDRTICGARSGFCFRPGLRVDVLLDRIDRQQRRLQFALVPGTEPVMAAGIRPAPGSAAAAAREFGERKKSAKPKRSAKALKREKKSKKRR